MILTLGGYGSVNSNIADNNEMLSLYSAYSFQRTYSVHFFF